MNVHEPGTIRNVVLVGHSGAGKTTLTEALLFVSGALTRMGKIGEGNTVSDHDPEEIRRGISVSMSLAPIEWQGVKINILDTPGYADFIGDVHGAIRASDACLFVVSAVTERPPSRPFGPCAPAGPRSRLGVRSPPP